MTVKKNKRIVLAKFGVDAHSNGIFIVSSWLRDSGFEVIYMGLYNTAEKVIKTAMQEDVDLIGCSFSEGSHLFHVKKLFKEAKKNGLDNVKFVVGGVIPPEDIKALKKMGVAEVFTAVATKEEIVKSLKSI
jgi:methylmalonyl-CoA mutase, C-terminal domain